MTVGSWTPPSKDDSQTAEIDADFLQRCLVIGRDDQQLQQLKTCLSDADQSNYSALMRLPQQAWSNAVTDFSAADIYALMRFFTVAEMQLPGWEADALSPVIWLNKALKHRGEGLQREQVMWIKQNTRNRYLPNGAVI